MATLTLTKLKNGDGLFFTFFLLFLLLLVAVSGVSTETASNSKSFTPDLDSCQCGLFLLNSPSLQTLPGVNSKPVVSGLAVAANCSSKNDRESCASTCLKLVHVMAANDLKSPIVHLVAEVATRTIACQSISSASMKSSRKSMKKKGFNGLKIANNIHNDEAVPMEIDMDFEKSKVSGPKWLGGFYRWCDSTWTYAGISVQEPLCCLGPEAKTCLKDADGSFSSPKVNNSSSDGNEPSSSRNGRQSRFQEEDDDEDSDAVEEQEEEEQEKEEPVDDLKSSKKSPSSTAQETEAEVSQFDGLDEDDENDKDEADLKPTKTETKSKTTTKTKTSSSESKSKTKSSQPLKNRRSLNSTVLAEAFQFVGVFLRSLGYGNVAEGISQVLPTSKASELLERADVVGDWVWSYQDRYMAFPREFNLGYCYVEYMGFTVATEGLAATTSNIYNRIFKRRSSAGSGIGNNKMEHNQRHNYPHAQQQQSPVLMSMSMPMPMLPISYQPSTNPNLNHTKTSFNMIGQMGQHKTFFVPHPVYHFEMNRKARALNFDSDSASNSTSGSDAVAIQSNSHNETNVGDPMPISIPVPIPTGAENRDLTVSKSKSSPAQMKKSGTGNSNSTKSQGKGQGQGQSQAQSKNEGLMDLATAIVQSAMGDSSSGDNTMSSLVQNALPIVSKVAGNSPMIQSMVQNLVTSFLTPSRTPAPAPSPIKTASGPYQNPYQYQYPSQQQQQGQFPGQGQSSGQLKNPLSQGNFNTISTNNNNNNGNKQNQNEVLPVSSSSSKRPNRPRPNSNSNSSPTSNSNLNSIRKPPTPTSSDYDIEDQFTNTHDVSNSVDFSSNNDDSSESSRPNGLASLISSLLGDSSSDSESGNSSLTSLLGKIVQSAIKGYFGGSGSGEDNSKPSSSRRPYGNNKNSLKTGLGSSNEGESDIVSMIMDLVRPFFISFFGVVPDQPGYGQLSTSDRRDRQGLGKDSSPYLTNDPDATTGLLDLFFGSPSLPETGSVIYDFGNRMVFAFSRANEPVHGLYCFKQYTANKAWDYFRGGVRNLVK